MCKKSQCPIKPNKNQVKCKRFDNLETLKICLGLEVVPTQGETEGEEREEKEKKEERKYVYQQVAETTFLGSLETACLQTEAWSSLSGLYEILL